MRDKRTRVRGKVRRPLSERLSEVTISISTKTFILLAIIFLIALFLRGYYGYEPATRYDAVPYLYSGGSDSYYHQRAVEYALNHHRYLDFDPMLNYPIGFPNPRAPLFDTSVAVWGEILAPFFNGDAFRSASFVMLWITALFGALTVIPTYFLGKEAFNRRVGLIGAFLLAIMPASVERSVITNADHDSMALFFIITGFYFFLRALKTMKTERWVSSWKSVDSIVRGVAAALSQNKRAIAYSLMSGISLACVALIWQGYPYAIITILVYYLITVLIDKFRKIDSLSVTLITGTALFTMFVLIYPYYCMMNRYGQWYDTPFFMFFVAICVGFAFVVTRDYPWMFVIPAGIFVGSAVLGALFLIYPTFQTYLLTGQGYFFVQSKLYSTIAEAQPAQVSRMAIGFGASTFILALWGMIHVVYDSRKRLTHDTIFIVSFAVVGTLLTITQARFLFNGAPVFAILSAFVIWKLLQIIKFEMIPKNYEAYKGARIRGIFKSIKIRHVVGALFIAFLVILPNLYFSLDAAIPNEEKRKYDLQIYKALPEDIDLRIGKLSFRPKNYDAINGSYWYLGAFGYSLPEPSQYYSNAYEWLSRQDTDKIRHEDRPAFTSWWDYGFEAINRGDHPSVADNFQNGYQLAGSFLMAQNESEAIGFWCARLLEGAFYKNNRALPQNISDLLMRYRISPSKIEDILRNPQAYVKVVLASPSKYGNHSDDLSPANAKYAAIVYELVTRPLEDLARFYRDLRGVTGWDIKYFAVDSRLFPFSGENTGIFYAPAKLSDKRMRGRDRTLPYDYFMIKAVSELGQEYDADSIPHGVRLNQQNPYKIVYTPLFYNTMLYRAFVGYGPAMVNRSGETGVPGLTSSGGFGNNPPLQGWMLSHFRVAYKTVYWNPYSPENVSKHQDAWRAINWEEGQKYKAEKKGTLVEQPDTQVYQQNGGVVILRYYDGAYVNGTVRTSKGRVLPGVRVTVTDEMGVPHQSVLTDSQGRYSILAPFGNLTLTVSTGGGLDYIKYVESIELGTAKLNVTVEQADRLPYDLDKDGKVDYEIQKDIIVKEATLKGKVALDSDQVGGIGSNDTLLIMTDVTLRSDQGQTYTVKTNARGEFIFRDIAPGTYTIMTRYKTRTLQEPKFIELKPGDSQEKDWAIKVGRIIGNLTGSVPPSGRMILSNGTEVAYASISEKGEFNFYDVFPGTYTITLDSRNLTVGARKVRINGTESVKVTYNVVEGVPVRLVLKISSETGFIPASGAPVLFMNMNDFSGMILNADLNGVVDAVIPQGYYSMSSVYYYSGGVTGFVRGRSIVGEYSDEITLTPAVKVWGNVTMKDHTRVETPRVYFYRDGGYITALGDSQGTYSALVPRGDYVVVETENRVTEHYAQVMDVSIRTPMRLDITLQNASRVWGYVYADENANSRLDPGEGIPYAGIEVKCGSISYVRVSSGNGSYDVILPHGSDYRLSVVRGGVESVARDVKGEDLAKSANMELNLMAPYIPVPVKGTLFYSGKKVDREVVISFTRVFGNITRSTNVTSKNGDYEAFLVPGNYEVKIDEKINDVAWYRYSGNLVVSLAGLTHNITISKEVNLTFTASGTEGNVSLTLISEKHRYNASGQKRVSITVEAGEYNLTARVGDRIFLTRVTINEGVYEVTGEPVKGVRVMGSVRSKGVGKLGIPITIYEKESGWYAPGITTSSGGEYEVYLMPGKEYTFRINHTVNESKGDTTVPVEYSFQGTITAPFLDMYTYDMYMSSRIVNVSLLVQIVDLMGRVAPGIPLYISGGIVNHTFVTDMNGVISTELPPGAYTLYTSTVINGIPMSIFKRVSVSYGSGLTLKPLALMYSASISGEIKIRAKTETVKTEATLRITSQDLATIERVYNGNYRVYVPIGNYSIRGETHRTEYGMDIIYSDTRGVNASADVIADLILERENHYAVRMDWDTSQKQTLHQGEKSVSPYIITVENIGNAPDTYTFTCTPSAWNFTVAPSELTLEPGNGVRKGMIYVSFQVPWNEPVAHSSLIVTAKSKNSAVTSTKGIEVNVVQVYGVRLNKKSAIFNESNASITIEVKNIGNGDDNYTLRIINSQELMKNGWEVMFRSGNQTMGSVSQKVAYGESKDVVVVARPAITNPTRYVYVEVLASSVKGAAEDLLRFELSLPDAEPVDARVYGVDIWMVAQNIYAPWYPIIAAIPISIVIVIFVYFLTKHGYRGLIIAIKRSFRRKRR